jgi:subtilisin family serine protease
MLPKAKLIQFPCMRLEPAYWFSEMLQNKVDSHSIKLHYDVVSLNLYTQFEQELSIVCSILRNFFQICKANELLLFTGQNSLVPVLTTTIKNSLPTQIDEYPTVKINNETNLEGVMPLNENIHPFAISDADSTFTFDNYLQPADYSRLKNVLATPSTAYNYWQLQRIHKKFGYTGKGIKVAVIDTGITFHTAFPNLSYDQIMRFPSRCPLGNFDWVGHGTQCAGIICGKGFQLKNSNGTIVNFPPGVAPDAELTVCKVTTGSGSSASKQDMTHALEWLVDKDIDIVNISMGSLQFSMEEAGAINDLVKKGVIVVCAASNDGHKFSQPISYPALLGNVLCIGSHGRHGKPSPFSPVGQQVDFLAPGEEVYCPSNTIRLDSVVQDSGTSFAAPAVAGLVCLIL